jgi:hypothetical protein
MRHQEAQRVTRGGHDIALIAERHFDAVAERPTDPGDGVAVGIRCRVRRLPRAHDCHLLLGGRPGVGVGQVAVRQPHEGEARAAIEGTDTDPGLTPLCGMSRDQNRSGYREVEPGGFDYETGDHVDEHEHSNFGRSKAFDRNDGASECREG